MSEEPERDAWLIGYAKREEVGGLTRPWEHDAPLMIYGVTNRPTNSEPVFTRRRAPSGEPEGWRPMDSAPRDGTFVIVGTASGMIAAMQFCSAGYWRSHVMGEPGIKPIGWMPLPAPPRAPQEGTK